MVRGAFRVVIVVLLAALLTAAWLPTGFALSAPRTLAHPRWLGLVSGLTNSVDPPFPIDYLGVSWAGGSEPSVRFLVNGRWSGWRTAHVDDLPNTDGRTFSALIPAADADAFRVRGRNTGVKVVAINTTDGPRSLVARPAVAEASHLTQPAGISRSGWGADESYRFSDGTEKWPQAFYATQKLIVHHTATRNKDRDPAATVRAIYRYHAIDRGWGDIGYNFLIDTQGRIYKGRYSGPLGTRNQDTPTGENAQAYGVTGAHTGGWNSGTMGIAILGTYTEKPVPAAARSALIEHLAWESEHHGLDPLATSEFTNPVSGAKKTNPNISGHLDWVATLCPGEIFYSDLPAIRTAVAARVAG